MSDLISRSDAIDALERIGSLDTDADREYARSIIKALPSAYTVPGEWYEDAVKANHGLVKENSELKEQLESASDAYMRGFDDCKRAYEVELARSADAKAHEEEHLKIINRVKELQYEIAKTQTVVSKMVKSADAVQGEWIFNTDENNDKSWNICSVCGYSIFHKTNFCPNCGAVMEGGDDE